MPRHVSKLLPSTAERLGQLGQRLRLARLRRRLSATLVAARAGMAPMTLRSLERGGPAVSIGAYAAVMQVLGLEHDLDQLANVDETGRSLQDARLSPRPRRARPGAKTPTSERDLLAPHDEADARRSLIRKQQDSSGFVTARALLDGLPPASPRRVTAKRR